MRSEHKQVAAPLEALSRKSATEWFLSIALTDSGCG
jgi:hypothetical protein